MPGCGNACSVRRIAAADRCAGAIPSNVAPDTLPYHKTFDYTGAKQSFKVPSGVTSITVVALGAPGSGYGCNTKFHGRSRGGRVFAVIPVTPHQRLAVYVGGNRGESSSSGGFNGGGGAGGADGGGGASDVRVSRGGLRDRILVAGGGGGQGGNDYLSHDEFWGCGGGGGTSLAVTGKSALGIPASQVTVARAAPKVPVASVGQVENAQAPRVKRPDIRAAMAALASVVRAENPASSAGTAGGGGGGSSYAEPSATQVRMWHDWPTARGNGLVVFSWQ